MNLILIFLFVFRETSCEDVSSESKNNMQHETTDQNPAVSDPLSRRFIEDMDDEEWHVSHLRDSNMIRRSGCEEETFINQYRKALRNDGALVQYVSADALQPGESDLLQSNKCPAPNNTDVLKAFSEKTSKIITKRSNITSSTSNTTNPDNETVAELIQTATTSKDKAKSVKKSKRENATAEQKSRRGDYQFSSVEYYDDVLEFDGHECPDAVQVIDLEIDSLRSYDIECESMIEWRSLDNP